ncbi:MAG: 3-methyladenine DNA glycosylase AlkC [Flavobacteriales bacterium]|jgi:3-methyladenine DNA glycosylase AlkC
MEEGSAFKDIFSPALVNQLGTELKSVYGKFDLPGFEKDIVRHLEPLSLSQRAKCISDGMKNHLPKAYSETALILHKVLGPEADAGDWSDNSAMRYWPFGVYIVEHGIDHYDESVGLMYELTKRFTAEWAIRPFIEKYYDKMMPLLHTWSQDENVHVRRLVSEGSRPRLPWAPKLVNFIQDPTPVIELITKLNNDPELYVRRSVANNINDIAKDHPDLAVKTLLAWQKNKSKNTDWIIGHASRTLLKNGHPDALRLQGFNPNIKLSINKLSLTDKVQFGTSLDFEFTIESQENSAEEILVDYLIHHLKANGKTSPKVFKLTKKKLVPGESITITKSHSMRPISTRKYYAGEHALEIQVNGITYGQHFFTLNIKQLRLVQ